ncbi:MAG: DUF455 family protein [Polyangiaceae bacterium]
MPAAPACDPRLASGTTVPGGFRDLSSPEARPALIAVLHRMLTDVEIRNVENCARLILESAEMPWAFVVDMARQCWDEARHGLAFLRRITELGGRFGDHPISSYLWFMGSDQPTDVRLAVQQRIGEWSGVEGALWHTRQFVDAGDERTAAIWEFVAQDEIGHVAFGNKWLRHLSGNDDAAVSRIHDRALAVRRAHGKSLESQPIFRSIGRPAFAPGSPSPPSTNTKNGSASSGAASTEGALSRHPRKATCEKNHVHPQRFPFPPRPREAGSVPRDPDFLPSDL